MAVNTHVELTLEKGSLTICSFYRFGAVSQTCTKARCGHLHVCPSYLAGFCHFQSRCKLSHSLLDDHNQRILGETNPVLTQIPCAENLREIVHRAFPKVCGKYNSVKGCSNDAKCWFLHVCGDMVNNRCRGDNCKLNHKHFTDHEKSILTKFKQNTHAERNFKLLFSNVLYAEGSINKNVRRCQCNIPSSDYSNLSRSSSMMTLDDDGNSSDESVNSTYSGYGGQRGGGRGRGRGRGGKYRGHGENRNGNDGRNSGDQNKSDRGKGQGRGGRGQGRGGNANRGDGKNVPQQKPPPFAKAPAKKNQIPPHMSLNLNHVDFWSEDYKDWYEGFYEDYSYVDYSSEDIYTGVFHDSGRGRGGKYRGHGGAGGNRNDSRNSGDQNKSDRGRGQGRGGNANRGGRGGFAVIDGKNVPQQKPPPFAKCPGKKNQVPPLMSLNPNHVDDSDEDIYTGINDSRLDSTKRENKSVDPELVKIREILVRNGGLMNYRDLVRVDEVLQLIAEDFNLKSWLHKNKSHFILNYKVGSDKIEEVGWLLGVKICMMYNTKGCKQPECKDIHVCKAYIEDTCDGGGCKLAHNFHQKNTLSILHNVAGVISLPKTEILRNAVANSLPKICPDWVNKGTCANDDQCDDLHLCQGYIAGACKNKQCRLQHDFRNKKSMEIFRKYELKDLFNVEALMKVILFAAIEKKPDVVQKPGQLHEFLRRYLLERGGLQKYSVMIADKTLTENFPPGKFEFVGWLRYNKRQFYCHCIDDQIDRVGCLQPIPIRLCHKYNSNEGCTDGAECKYMHVCIGYIVGACKSCPKAHDFNEPSTSRILFADNKIPTDLDTQTLRSIVLHSLPQICEAMPHDGPCHKMHICPDFGKCKNQDCRFPHNIRSPDNQKILRAFEMLRCPDQMIAGIVLPPKGFKPRQEVNDVENSKSQPAPPVKKEGKRARYKPGEGKHRSKQKNKNQRKGSTAEGAASENSTNRASGTDDNSNPEICEANVRKKCKKGNCPYIHRNLPYQWQYKQDDSWHDFSDQINIDIEENYSMPDKKSWVRQQNVSDKTNKDDLLLKGDLMLLFEQMRIMHSDGSSDVRRLSTLPSASADDDQVFATRWSWYYFKDNVWLGGHSEETEDIMMQVELAYLDKSEEFEIDDKVLLKLQGMKAINVTTREELPLQRRPVFVDEEYIQNKMIEISKEARPITQQPPPVPVQTTNQVVHDVLDEKDPAYSEIEQLIIRNLPSKIIKIHRIERVINDAAERSYNEQKSRFLNHPDGRLLKQRQLFYSCDPELVAYVKQHGALSSSLNEKGIALPDLGEGFYFTRDPEPVKDASSNNNLYFVFIARVLTLSVKTGSLYETSAYDRASHDSYCSADMRVLMKTDQSQTCIDYLAYFDMKDMIGSPSSVNPISTYNPPIVRSISPRRESGGSSSTPPPLYTEFDPLSTLPAYSSTSYDPRMNRAALRNDFDPESFSPVYPPGRSMNSPGTNPQQIHSPIQYPYPPRSAGTNSHAMNQNHYPNPAGTNSHAMNQNQPNPQPPVYGDPLVYPHTGARPKKQAPAPPHAPPVTPRRPQSLTAREERLTYPSTQYPRRPTAPSATSSQNQCVVQ